MRIAVLNEVSAVHRNEDILKALKGFDNVVFNVGMKSAHEKPELTYIHTGLMAALLLNLQTVDLVVGGCGTGQGFLNSAMQYPGVFCGLIQDPLDAWLFSQINGGNCISLALNKGYGWAGDINLKYIFEKLFKDEMGSGYPEHRKESQRESRDKLAEISMKTHKSIDHILNLMDSNIVSNLSASREFCEALKNHSQNEELKDIMISKYLK